MNCSDFEMNVLALVRTELIDVAWRDEILGHSENCLRCADRLTGEQALLAGVQAVVADLAEQKAPAHVRSALLAAFREHTAATTDNNVIPMPLKVARHWKLEAVAAAILLMASMAAIFWIYSRPPIEKHLVVTVPSEPKTIEPPSTTGGRNNVELSREPVTAPAIKSRHRAAKHLNRAREEVTEFFPLMEGIDLDSLEAVQAVRVELPESALNDLGLPAGVEAPHGPIRADVLLGIDGVARAIRFVR